MSRSLKRLARRALIERQKDVYYHDLMQLRREQQLEQILRTQQQPVVVAEHQHRASLPLCAPEYVIVSEDQEMPCQGPSSQDWMLVLIMVFGASGLTFAVCLLLFLAASAIGLVGSSGQ